MQVAAQLVREEGKRTAKRIATGMEHEWQMLKALRQQSCGQQVIAGIIRAS